MSTFCSFFHPSNYRRIRTVAPKTQKTFPPPKNTHCTMPSTFKDDAPPSNPPLPPSPRRDTATSWAVQFSSLSRAAAFVSGIGSAVAFGDLAVSWLMLGDG
jgi:hypothetical protein